MEVLLKSQITTKARFVVLFRKISACLAFVLALVLIALGFQNCQGLAVHSSGKSSTVSNRVSQSPAPALSMPTIYVDPVKGSDSNLGSQANPLRTIIAAKNLVRTLIPTMHGNITVDLAPGTYRLDSPIAFTALDAGKDNYVITYQADPGTPGTVLVTGGRKVPGDRWTLWQNGIFQAHICGSGSMEEKNCRSPSTLRQLYLNGIPQRRSRFSLPLGKVFLLSENPPYINFVTPPGNHPLDFAPTTGFVLNPGPIYSGKTSQMGDLNFVMQGDGNLVLNKGSKLVWMTASQPGWSTQICGQDCLANFQGDGNLCLYNHGKAYWCSGTAVAGGKTPTGFEFHASLPPNLSVDDIEVVDLYQWRIGRCGVTAIGPSFIALKKPCYDNLIFGRPTYLENDPSFIRNPGDWAYVASSGTLYYMPNSPADLQSGDLEIPVDQVSSLITGVDTQNLVFSGITFSLSSWNWGATQDGSNLGYTSWQAGYHYTTKFVQGLGSQIASQIPAAVAFSNSRNISFLGNTFTDLGGAGISFSNRSQNNTISKNRFRYISGGAVTIGGIDDRDRGPSAQNEQTLGNKISDNTISDIGLEYFDSVAIFLGYTSQTVVEHNSISNLPYTGISVGWGWNTAETNSTKNLIRGNRIYDIMRVLTDGGGIYTLGAQQGTVIERNCIYNIFEGYQGVHEILWAAGVYLDNGSEFIVARDNSVAGLALPSFLNVCQNQNSTPIDSPNNAQNNTVSNNDVSSAKNEDGTPVCQNAGPRN